MKNILFLTIVAIGINCQAQIVTDTYQDGSKNVSFVRHDVDTFDGATDVWVVDIDNDGFNDIIGTSYNNGICWWKNDGNQNFSKNQIAEAIPAGSSRSLRVTMHDGSNLDFNNDGFVDMVSAMGNTNEIVYWLNDGLGNFTPTSIDNTSKGAHTIDVIDLDKDGDIDILASAFGTETENGEFAIYYNDGNQSFTKEILHSLPTTGGTFIHSGDVDADNNNDILFTEWHWQNPSDLGIYRKTETGWEKIVIDSYVGMHTAMLKDYDKDGDLDILAATWNGSFYFIYTNDGAGNFTKTWQRSAFRAIWLDMADFDNDGDNDLLGVAQNPGVSPDLYWYENDGNFSFTSNTICSNIIHVYSGIPSDLDNDGDQDIILAANESDKIVWWENKFIDHTTSLDQITNDNNLLNVYPNPATTQVSIRFYSTNAKDTRIVLMDLNGKIIHDFRNQRFTDGNNQISFDTSNYADGIYVIKVNDGKNITVAKIIVSK